MATRKQVKFQKLDTTNPKHKKLVKKENAKGVLSKKLLGVRAKGVMYAKSGDTPMSKTFQGLLNKKHK